jgi:outer membrane PBP1 activator LpoA protein
MLQQAKSLLEEKKVQQASQLLSRVAELTLNDEQQELLTGLKSESQKLLTEVDKGLGNLKSLIQEKNYTEATSLVSKLTEYELSSDQQSLLDGLKAELEKLMESEAGQGAADAVNDLLGR